MPDVERPNMADYGVPADPVAQTLLSMLDEPLMSTSLILPDADDPLSEPEDIRAALDHALDSYGQRERRFGRISGQLQDTRLAGVSRRSVG